MCGKNVYFKMASKMAAAPLHPIQLHLDLSWSDEFGVFRPSLLGQGIHWNHFQGEKG